MNSADLANIIADKHGIPKADAKSIVGDIFAAIVDAAKRGEETSVHGFGKFSPKHRPAREGRNPANGKAVQIAASMKLTFATAKAVKDALNPG